MCESLARLCREHTDACAHLHDEACSRPDSEPCPALEAWYDSDMDCGECLDLRRCDPCGWECAIEDDYPTGCPQREWVDDMPRVG